MFLQIYSRQTLYNALKLLLRAENIQYCTSRVCAVHASTNRTVCMTQNVYVQCVYGSVCTGHVQVCIPCTVLYSECTHSVCAHYINISHTSLKLLAGSWPHTFNRETLCCAVLYALLYCILLCISAHSTVYFASVNRK